MVTPAVYENAERATSRLCLDVNAEFCSYGVVKPRTVVIAAGVASAPVALKENLMPNVTLRDLAQLGNVPSALDGSALVMIDCQNTYRRGTMALVGVEPALIEAQSLLRRA